MKNKFQILPHFLLLLLLAGCSTTDRLPEGETLYTGIGTVSYVDQGGKDKNSRHQQQKGGVIVAIADAAQQVKHAFEGKSHSTTKESSIDTALLSLTPDEREVEALAFEPVEEELEAVLAYPPNNSFFGSSRVRTPLPIGLWAYNAWGDKQKGLGHFLYKDSLPYPLLHI